MIKLLHPLIVYRGVCVGLRWRLKRLLGIPIKPHNPVVGGDPDAAFQRHLKICTLLNNALSTVPHEQNLKIACEIGCGDCLSTADLLLGAGFEKVYLVEKQPIVLDEKQNALLTRMASLSDLPNSKTSLSDHKPPKLGDQITIIPEYFEDAVLPESVDFIFSNDVVEHVEDLPRFFSACNRILNQRGIMVHKFDLSGHEFFEDPIPPLDFQTYPRWLYVLMFPKYRRAVGNFADTIFDEIRKQGFEISQIIPVRTAEPEYLDEIWSSLRKEAHLRSRETVSILDVIVIAKKTST